MESNDVQNLTKLIVDNHAQLNGSLVSLQGKLTSQLAEIQGTITVLQGTVASLQTHVAEENAALRQELADTTAQLTQALTQLEEQQKLFSKDRECRLTVKVLDSKLDGKPADDYVGAQLRTLGYNGTILVAAKFPFNTKQQQGTIPAGSRVWVVDFTVESPTASRIIRTQIAPNHTPRAASAWSADYAFLSLGLQKTKAEVAAEKTIQASPDFQHACRMAKAQGLKVHRGIGKFTVGKETWDTAKVAALGKASVSGTSRQA